MKGIEVQHKEKFDAARHFLSREQSASLLNESAVRDILESRQNGSLNIVVGNRAFTISQRLGSGGTKEVYDVHVGNSHFAMALPGSVDLPKTIVRKWRTVLNEPDNTRRLRDANLRVNSLSQLIQTKINGHFFPALLMKRYEDLPFTVRDSKNIGVGASRIFLPGMTVEQIAETIRPMAADIHVLLQRDIRLGRDSFNLCLENGYPHIFFNDLGSAGFEPILEADIDQIAGHYADATVGAVLNGITEAEYREFQADLDDGRDLIVRELKTAALVGLR